jgi:type IV pilus assembly protein PilE
LIAVSTPLVMSKQPLVGNVTPTDFTITFIAMLCLARLNFHFDRRTMVSSHKILGFTLLELAILIVIIVSYAIFNSPGHKRYLMQTKRSDARKALVNLWYEQQAYQKACGRYAEAIGEQKTCVASSNKAGDHTLVASSVSAQGYYALSIVSATETSYVLQAIPVPEKEQVHDSDCAKFTLDYAGNKRAYNQLNQLTTRCWQTKS